MLYPEQFDVIVVGGGHAASQAAHVCSLMNMKTMMITPNLDTIGLLSCNVGMGGVGKAQSQRDQDALGVSISSHCIDLSGTNFTVLNSSKGPAMHSPHVILDKNLYKMNIQVFLQNLPNLSILQQTVEDVLIENNKAVGVITQIGMVIKAKAVIICAGTFLNGKIHVGLDNYSGGRQGEAASISLSQRLKELKLPQGRMKTGTPPRIDGRTIDFSKLNAKWGDGVDTGNVPVFSIMGNREMHPKQLPCWITRTNEATHNIIRSGFDRSPFIQAHFEGPGPRYCPSIEDKITRFADKDSHQIILEPEGLTTFEYYPNGVSNSLPLDVQIQFIQSMEGLEKAVITRPGYAIEYDYFAPTGFKQTLEFKDIENLYMAGTPLGTSGYSEAQATGTISAINACLKIQEKDAWVPARHESYMGVLIDDITVKGVEEPYRLLTSRAENRLLLRWDNAEDRLTEIGRALGLVKDAQWAQFNIKQEAIAQIQEQYKMSWINPKTVSESEALEHIGQALKQELSLESLIKRPEMTFDKIAQISAVKDMNPMFTRENLEHQFGVEMGREIAQRVEIEFKYEGYINLQKQEIEKMTAQNNTALPEDFDYNDIKALSTEVKQKLNKHRPVTICHASRISGVTPAAIGILLIYLKKNKLLNKAA